MVSIVCGNYQPLTNVRINGLLKFIIGVAYIGGAAKKGKTMTTPGELLAKKLSGDDSISSDDIDRATVQYFTDHGCNAACGRHSSASIRAAAQESKEETSN